MVKTNTSSAAAVGGEWGTPHCVDISSSCSALAPVSHGSLPATIDDCTALMQAAAVAEHVPGAVRCIAIARARQLFADERAGDWINWVGEQWPGMTSKCEVHHKRAIGDLLIRARGGVWYTTLMQTSQDKLLAISRLPADRVAPFLDAGDVSNQTRDQVRARVAKWLGEELPGTRAIGTPGSGATVPANSQPTFLDNLFALCTPDGERQWRIDIALRAQQADRASNLSAAIRAISAIDEIAPRVDVAAGQHLVLASALRTEAEKLEKLNR